MEEIDIALPPTRGEIAEHIDRAIRSIANLRTASRGTLKTLPGSIHWHLKFADEPGTLELTYWPATKRLWFKIHPRRRADWMDDVMKTLTRNLTRAP